MEVQKKTKIIIGVLVGLGALAVIVASIIAVVAFVIVKKVNKPDTKDPKTTIVQKEYTVSFDTDGGNTIESIKVKEGKTVSLPGSPTKEGYIFSGWTLDGEAFDATLEVKKDITLKASWIEETKETVTVKFNTDGGAKLDSVVLEKGSAITLPKIANKKGYAFVKWVDAKNNQVKDGDKINSNMTLKAIWKVVEDKSKNDINNTNTDTTTTTDNNKTDTTTTTDNNKVETPSKTIGYECPSGYTLSGTTCTKKETIVASSTACPTGTSEIDGKCVTVSNATRKDPNRECKTWTYGIDNNGHTETSKGVLQFAGYYYCVYGQITASQYQTQSECQTAHVWANGKCWYAKTGAGENINYTCNTGYVYVTNPNDYVSNTGMGAGCFPVQNKPTACPDDSYKLSTDPYLGRICSKTTTIDATKVEK